MLVELGGVGRGTRYAAAPVHSRGMLYSLGMERTQGSQPWTCNGSSWVEMRCVVWNTQRKMGK